MPAPDTNPVFWREWRQLGHAVVIMAVEDYVSLRKKIDKLDDTDEYGYRDQLAAIERFFRSKRFGRMCPEYDGYILLGRLETNWRHIKRLHRYTSNPVSQAKEYQYKEHPLKRGRPRKYDSEWGQY